MRTRDLADEFLEFRRYMVVTAATIEAYEWALGRLAKDIPELPCTELALLKALNPPGLALDSRRSLRRMANTFFRWLELQKGIPNICRDLPRPVGKEVVRRILAPEELDLLTAAAKPRNRVLIALAMDAGLRVDEIHGLRPQDVGPDWVAVWGKTGARYVPISPEVRDAVLAQAKEGILWWGQRGPLTLDGLKANMKKLFARAGIGTHKAGYHCLRHTFATLFLRDGGGIRQLQDILGHKNMETTIVYVHLAGVDVLKAQREHSPATRLNLLGAAAPASGAGMPEEVARAYVRGIEEGRQQAHVELRALGPSDHGPACSCETCFTLSVILARHPMAA